MKKMQPDVGNVQALDSTPTPNTFAVIITFYGADRKQHYKPTIQYEHIAEVAHVKLCTLYIFPSPSNSMNIHPGQLKNYLKPHQGRNMHPSKI